jgi:PAS domain S-box-containing protein
MFTTHRSRIEVVAIAAGLLLAIQIASRVLDLGSADASVAAWSYGLLMAGSAAAVALRAALVPQRRLAWALIALGLACWGVGDALYALGGIGHVDDVFYLFRYVAFIAGLRLLGGKRAGSAPLGIVLMSLATLWSWLVFGDVIAGASTGGATVAFTTAYSLLDLVLLAAVLLSLAARGWRWDLPAAALSAGFVILVVADSIYAQQVVLGTYRDGTLLAAPWPAAAMCVAAGGVLDRGPRRPARGDRDIAGLVMVAIAAAVLVQFVDHFSRVHTLTFVLSGVTLVAAVLQRLLLNRERAQALKERTAAEAIHSASAEAALDCIISIDGAGTVSEWNEAARRTFGYKFEEANGRELAQLIIPPNHRDEHRRGLRRMVAGEEPRILNRPIDVMAMRRGGEKFPVELTVTQVRLDPPLFTGFLRDASDQRRREEENGRLAAIVRSSEDAILSKDLHGVVTAWNQGAEQLYGFSAAEAVGKPLLSLIVPPERAQELVDVTTSVVKGQPVAFDTRRRRKDGVMLDVSLRAFPIRNLAGEIVGASTIAHDITDRLRREGREREDAEGRLWRGRVETALRDGHLMFWGQPVLDPRTDAVHHHELLVRMDLDGDVIAPSRFLPHAEASGLITDIDRWAIQEGIAFASAQRVAINLSAKSLQRPDLIDDIKRALADGAPAGNVIFEITETAAVENLDAARELVEQLIALGCGVALDDFGTGYGSFTYLKHLPVTELKIDIDFVRDLAGGSGDPRLVQSIVSVARTFGMKTVAEGVEDEITLGVLRDFGVDFVQGYHVGYPTRMTTAGRWNARRTGGEDVLARP